MDKPLGLIGLAVRGRRAAVGELPVKAAADSGSAWLILTACDAADRTARQAERLAAKAGAPFIRTKYDKSELGHAVGRDSCAVLAITDQGLALALSRQLMEG